MLLARQFCFQSKNIRYQPQTASAAGVTLLTDGATPATYTGTLLDQTKTHNNEEFTFYMDKRRTFLKPFGYTNQAIPSVTTVMTSTDKSLVQFFTLTLTQKHMPAILKYNESAATYPINFNPLMALGYAFASNATPDGLSYS